MENPLYHFFLLNLSLKPGQPGEGTWKPGLGTALHMLVCIAGDFRDKYSSTPPEWLAFAHFFLLPTKASVSIPVPSVSSSRKKFLPTYHRELSSLRILYFKLKESICLAVKGCCVSGFWYWFPSKSVFADVSLNFSVICPPNFT